MRRRVIGKGTSGLTLIEVSISLVVVCVLMMAAVTSFASNLRAVDQASVTTSASIFLETTMEDLSAQNYEALLAMNGNRFFDGEDEASSRYAIDLTVFLSEVDLLQVRTVLTDLRTDRVLGHLTTLRTR